MTAQLDEAVATGMAKLAGREIPLKVLRLKFKLPELRLERDRLEQALADRRKEFKPWWKKGWSLPERLQPERQRLARLELELAKGDADFIEGVITPLTTAEEMEIDANRSYARLHLSKHPPAELETQEQKDEYEQIVDLAAAHTGLAKKAECICKADRLKSVPGKKDKEMVRERLFTFEEARKLDFRMLVEICQLHDAAFVPTEDELGKSAPLTRTI